VVEWYYPGGQLQKRFVKDKNGYAVEPIRLFHENGQLAEEVNTVEGKKRGPWLKFFPDGSPRLRAEYADDEQLIVHDAWDANGNQVVRNGTGTFHDDGRRTDWAYDLYFEHRWTADRELKNGVPDGKTTKYCEGVLWSVANYVSGKQEGEEATYWDNGRIREVTKYVGGKSGRSKSYPKFERPAPAVVLSVEANEKLYAAWRHIRVDEYPQVLNFDKVQGQLKVPDFLREVYERNLSTNLKSDYEDWNTFSDGIAYFLIVSATGEVTSATANGSGIYSGGEWGTYPPFLRQLRFKPGRIRGRAVECRVLAWVRHTFVESAEK
jgi:antitoxin component YwqK of YwqJK toxin-antitoxin module